MSLKAYVIDSAAGPAPRDWSVLYPAVAQAQFQSGRCKVQSEGSHVEEGVVIAHRSVIREQSNLNDLAQLCQLDRGPIVIVVSGSPQTEGEVVSRRLYYRRAPVDAPKDEVFASCWTAFMARIAEGTTDFELLEPPYLPTLWALDILCQMYRLAHGDPEFSAIRETPARRGDAETEPSSVSSMDVGWWLRGMGVESLEELESRLSAEVTKAMARDLVCQLRESGASPSEGEAAVKCLHGLLRAYSLGDAKGSR